MLPGLTSISLPGRRRFAALGLGLMAFAPALDATAEDAGSPGETIYRESCASCHGKSGEGVKGEHSRPLAGDKSIPQLAKYIEKWMPDEEPQKCVGEDAEKVARYIYDAFYSPIAQARNRPPRIELSRLTVRQYRNAVADLVGSFRDSVRPGAERGLRGEYYNSRDPGRRAVLRRLDPQVNFDFERSTPTPEGLDAVKGFSARWRGSVIAPETGDYEFVVRTDHAARLWVNDVDRPLVDVWVKSGDETEHGASMFLLGGRAYPIQLDFTSRQQGVQNKVKSRESPVKSLIELLWTQPNRVVEVIPTRNLTPARASELFVVGTPFPPDDRSVGYERGSSISKAWDDATTRAAIEAADYVVDHLRELSGARKSDSDRETKVRDFCERLLERAFRRPLTDEARQVYLDRRLDGAPDLESAVKRVVLLALKSPRFLYVDLGSKEADSYAVATRLSFALWDSLPDPQLLEAAAAGQLDSIELVRRQAGRMIDDLRTRSKVHEFLHGWLLVGHSDLAKDEKLYPGFNAALASDLRTSLDLFLDEVIWSDSADFRQLLLSGDLYLNGSLARYYGFDLPDDTPFQKVRTGRPHRVGVVSHPYLLANFAYRDASSPIHRGVFLMRGVLGRALRPPPEAAAPLAPDLHPGLTTRERVTLQTKSKTCQSCHETINALGFTLEHFDAVGRYREAEKQRPIDASGEYQSTTGGKTRFAGSRELAEFLAGSAETHQAFVTQLFHHLVKQPIFAYGPRTRAHLRRGFSAGNFNIQRLMEQIATRCALHGVVAESDLDAANATSYDERLPKSGRRMEF